MADDSPASSAEPARYPTSQPAHLPWVCPNPVFIIGSPRSGTTVLARSLAQHSEFWASGESYVLFFLFANRAVENAYERAMGIPGPRWLRSEDVSQEEFLAYVGAGVNALFTSRSEGRRWVDHTPLYTRVADTLADAFPGASFLHIVRDGREVVSSMLNFANAVPDAAVGRFLLQSVVWASDMRDACDAWRHHVERAMAFCDEHPDRAKVVRYEDLVAAPETTFRSIHRFLGVADEEGPARFFASRRINSSFRGRPRRSASELWEAWDEEQRRTFAEIAGPTMVKCEYSTPDELGNLVDADRPAG
jgi:Sulfotransferase family